MTPRPATRLALLAALLLACLPLVAEPEQAPDQPQDKPAADPVAQAIAELNEADNGIKLDREQKTLDIQSKVCLREGEFLEMFACTKDTREHESILLIQAVPSTIHLGLLLLGLEPGRPLSYDMDFDPPRLLPARGPEVEVFVVYTINGRQREMPANRWIQDNSTGQTMQGNTWLFAGSVISEIDGQKHYMADVNGSVISLVNFGDDLLTLPNELTQDNAIHGNVWAPRTRAIPEVGTEVTLRLKVKAPQEQPQPDAAEPDKADNPAP